MTVAHRLADVRERIDRACQRAGRDPTSVTLVAVSKTHPAELVREAWAAGQRVFGENYVQELTAKAAALGDLDGLSWHFIGHLQRNKVKEVLGAASTIETIDSTRLAAEVAKRAEQLGKRVAVLIEVSVAGEKQKSGVAPADVPDLVESVRAFPALDLRGLMTVPPLSDDAEATRPHFRTLRTLARSLGLDDLSMGMTADYEIAIEEGATLVRIGTALFGAR